MQTPQPCPQYSLPWPEGAWRRLCMDSSAGTTIKADSHEAHQ